MNQKSYAISYGLRMVSGFSIMVKLSLYTLEIARRFSWHHCAGQRADTSYLDAIKVEDAPAHAVRLAAAELRLRVQEERRRRKIGLTGTPDMETIKMSGQPGPHPLLNHPTVKTRVRTFSMSR